MPNIPIFDSLTHPMPNGQWLGNSETHLNSIDQILADMHRHDINWGLAVGLGETIGDYQENKYSEFVKQHADNLFPVAYFDFTKINESNDINAYLVRLKSLGYIAIKIHPRIAGITFKHAWLVEIIKAANKLNLGVLLCTYFWGSCSPKDNNIHSLINLLAEIGDAKIILLHGGAVKLLELSESVRHLPNVLLDLSFTLCKYEGSSVDMDIQFLFNFFDRRICIGSDSPEFSHAKLRARFNHFSKNIDLQKAQNIAYKNIINHLSLNEKTSTN